MPDPPEVRGLAPARAQLPGLVMVQVRMMRTRLRRNALAETSARGVPLLKEAAQEVRVVRAAARPALEPAEVLGLVPARAPPPGLAMVPAVVSVRETALALASLAPLAHSAVDAVRGPARARGPALDPKEVLGLAPSRAQLPGLAMVQAGRTRLRVRRDALAKT